MKRNMKKIVTIALVGAFCFGQVFGMKRGRVKEDYRLCFSKYKGIESVESLRRKFMSDYEWRFYNTTGGDGLIAEYWDVLPEGKVSIKEELTVAQKLLGEKTIMMGSLKKVDLLIPSTVWNSPYVHSLVYPLNNQKSSFGQFVFELFKKVVVKIKLLYDFVENVERISDSHKKFIKDRKKKLSELISPSKEISFYDEKFCKEFFDCKSFYINKTVSGGLDDSCLKLYEELLYAGEVREPEKELRKINEMKEKHERISEFGYKLASVEKLLKRYLKLKKIISKQKLEREFEEGLKDRMMRNTKYLDLRVKTWD